MTYRFGVYTESIPLLKSVVYGRVNIQNINDRKATCTGWLFLILGYVLIQIQIRLEEEFLTKEHGQEYLNYKQKVRRLI